MIDIEKKRSMILKWSDFIKTHPANRDYNKNLMALQQLIPISDTFQNSFRHLTDNKSIICLTRGQEKEVQATFHHSILKKSFTDQNPTYIALVGFESRATAVRLDPSEIFKQAPKRKFPTFKALLACRTQEDLTTVEATVEKKADNYAIVPPFLATELLDEDDLSASNLLLKMILKVDKLIQRPAPNELNTGQGEESSDNSVEVVAPDLDEGEMTLGPDDPEPILIDPASEPTALAHPLEPSFERIFDFLFLTATGEKEIKPVSLRVCTKAATSRWTDEQHSKFLKHRSHTSPPQAHPMMGVDPRMVELTQKFGSLTDVIRKREEYELEAKAEKEIEKRDKGNGVKKFEKLSPIIKNIAIMFTVVEGMNQEDIDELAPTKNALSLLEINSGPVIKELLQNHLKAKGCMAYLQPGMCNSLKSLIIASYNDAYNPSNLCVFHCGPEKVGNDVTEEEIAILTEKANINKLKMEDIAKLTKNETYLPRDFWAYEHMIINFQELCAYIGGANSITTMAWAKIVRHAKQNQLAYKKYERENDLFYISLCDDWMRRTQTFIHSGASGKLTDQKREHIDFMPTLMDIEFHRYHVRRPCWMPRPKRKADNTNNQNGGGSGLGGGGNLNGKQENKRRNYGKGEIVVNDNLEEDMKVPSAVTYRELFSPDYIGKLKYVNHEDGSHKCHNWHHSGRCWTNCKRIASHKKKLTKKEIEEGKKFVLQAFGNWSAAKGKGDVPDGHPPKNEEADKKKEGEKQGGI